MIWTRRNAPRLCALWFRSDSPNSGHVAQQNFHHGTILFGPRERFLQLQVYSQAVSSVSRSGVHWGDVLPGIGVTVKKGMEPWVNAMALAV